MVNAQEAYETFRAALPALVCNVPAGPWDELSPAVQAGFAAIAARQPQTAPGQVRYLRDALERCRDAAGKSPAAVHSIASQALAGSACEMHLMTIGMAAWCGASGPGNGRASSQWREVTCPDCLAKGTAWLRALVWDMLQAMPAGREALAFAVRAGRLGVTDDRGRPLAMACATGEDEP